MTYMFELAITRPPFMDPPGSPGVVLKKERMLVFVPLYPILTSLLPSAAFQMVDTMIDDECCEADSYVMVDIPK